MVGIVGGHPKTKATMAKAATAPYAASNEAGHEEPEER